MVDVLINGTLRTDAIVQVRWFRGERDGQGDDVCFWAIEIPPSAGPDTGDRTAPVEITIAGRRTTGGWGKRDGTIYGVGKFPFTKDEWEAIAKSVARQTSASQAR